MSDAIVIGGGVSGLIAATYLARAGKQVTLLEAQDRLGGRCVLASFGEGFSASIGAQVLYAFDPKVMADLKLVRHGLKFAARDMPLVGLHIDGKHVVLQRDVHATASSIAVLSTNDAHAWPQFRRELFDLARSLRPLWQGNSAVLSSDVQTRVSRFSKMGASAWLDSWFESDLLKSTLCFDATSGRLSPLEPGSALTLIWRAAQEMYGLQGAVSMAEGGTLMDAVVAVARAAGVDIQTGARVVEVLSDGDRVTGVRLADGGTMSAPQIVSTLSRRSIFQTMIPPLSSGIAQSTRDAWDMAGSAEVRVLLALRERPRFGDISDGARLVLSDSASALITADLSARAGRLADELPMEVTLPAANDHSSAPNGQHIISLLLRPVPQNPAEGWQSLKPKLAERAVQTLERFAPGTAAKIVAVKIFAPDNRNDHAYHAPSHVEHLLASYETRIQSPLHGLVFCGDDAEPVPAVSGRAARLAAAMLTRGA